MTKTTLTQKAKVATANPIKAATFTVPLNAAPALVPEVSADISMKEEEELCQAFSDTLLAVEDIDAEDSEQPQLCSEYVKDIYAYLMDLEVCTAEAIVFTMIAVIWVPEACCAVIGLNLLQF